MLQLEQVHARTEGIGASLTALTDRLPEVVAWITWGEIREIVVRQAGTFSILEEGIPGSVQRLSDAVTTAINWHS